MGLGFEVKVQYRSEGGGFGALGFRFPQGPKYPHSSKSGFFSRNFPPGLGKYYSYLKPYGSFPE